MSDRIKGLSITLFGVLMLCPDTLIIRLVDADAWSILFWRGLFAGIGVYMALGLVYRQRLISVVYDTGKFGLLLTGIFCISNICFITSVTLTSVAHTLVIVATTPMFAAIGSFVFLKEPVHKITILAMVSITIAVAVLVFGDPQAEVTLLGDCLAVVTSICMATCFVLTRHAKDRDMSPTMGASALLSAMVVVPLVTWGALDAGDMMLILVLGACIAVSLILLMVGPRFITAPEVGLLMPVETVVAVYLVWIFAGEEPSTYALWGGALIVAILVLHSLVLLRGDKRT